MSRITGAEVRSIELRRPGWGRRGYAPSEVDAFLARAADALDASAAGQPGTMTPDDVHHVVFRKPPLGSGRGYDEDQVDDLLDRIEQALRAGPGWTSADGVMLNGRPIDESAPGP